MTRHDKLNLSDSAIMWEEASNASCVINSDYKILWVVNSENYIYKRNALNRAKEVIVALLIFHLEPILRCNYNNCEIDYWTGAELQRRFSKIFLSIIHYTRPGSSIKQPAPN